MKPGELFAGRYRVGTVLGRGGMGTVYEVEDTLLGRARALKVLHGHFVEQAELRERFALEARLGGRIDSPYLVDVVDAGVEAERGHPYLVMERLVGESLAQRTARLGPRPAPEVVDHLGQLAVALDRMHAAGVVHRDLKPANLFLHARASEASRLKVLDLGIAKVLGPGAGDTTGVAGTPAFMAPEQLRGRGVTAATDRYALGLIAYALLVGRGYWIEAEDLDPIAFGLRIVDGPREPATVRARALGVELPPGFDRWFARATASDPGRRFPSSVAAIHALAVALGTAAPPCLAEVSGADDGPPPDEVAAPTAPRDGRTEAATPARVTPRARGWAALRRWRRIGWLVAVVGVVGAGAIALGRGRGGAAGSRSPLARPEAVLACPILAVDVPERDGWLGAAAASLVCERARVILGGQPARTRLPAELLGLPPAPAEDFPVEPFAGVAARQRSLEAARRQAAYLDGKVQATAGGFRVELALYGPRGALGAPSQGEGVALIDAVRAAMAPMIATGALPWAAVADPTIGDYVGAAGLPTQLELLDLTLGFAQNAGQVGRACAAFLAEPRASTLRLDFARHECAYTLGYRSPPVVLPAAVATDGERALRARIEHMVHRRDDVSARDALTTAYALATTSWARSTIATTLSCLWETEDVERATSWSLLAIEAEPKNPIGEWCAPWEQLTAVTAGGARQGQVAIAGQGWRPWHPYHWWLATGPVGGGAERAYLLAPFNTVVATAWYDALLAAGRLGDAHRVAARLATGEAPVQRLQAAIFAARLDVAEARFVEALVRLAEQVPSRPDDAGWTHDLRLVAAVEAMQLAVLLDDRPRRRQVVAAVLAGPSSSQVPVDVAGFRNLAAVCAYADDDQRERCFALLPGEWVRPAQPTPLSALVDGARAFAARDLRGAVRAWRTIAATEDQGVGLLAQAMVEAFAAADEPAFIDLVVSKAPRWAGASAAMARAALAAADRGDRIAARALAGEVVDAWKLSSTEFPLLTELRRLAR
jgi:tRNA A-37 threonylcarbamoyl transferase component Bud32